MTTVTERQLHDNTRTAPRERHPSTQTPDTDVDRVATPRRGCLKPTRPTLTWHTAVTIGLALIYLVSLIGLVQTTPTPMTTGAWTPAIASVMGTGTTTVALTAMGFITAVRATQ